jgi:hypothetical protein
MTSLPHVQRATSTYGGCGGKGGPADPDGGHPPIPSSVFLIRIHEGRNPMSRKLLHSLSFLVALAVLGILVVGASADAPAPARSSGPVLTAVLASAAQPGSISVSGEGFTPGGDVYVAIYDTWGAELHETRWTTASIAAYGPSGSLDPALGYHAGGRVSESFAGLCGNAIMLRAFDRQAAVWTNLLDVDSVAITAAFFGLNGSLDPAMGYRAGC